MQIRVCRRGTGTAGDQKSCNGMATIKANGRGVGVTDRSRGQEEERRREGYLRSLPRREKLQLDSAWLETNPSVPSFRKVGSFRADVKMRELSKVFYYRDRSSAIDPRLIERSFRVTMSIRSPLDEGGFMKRLARGRDRTIGSNGSLVSPPNFIRINPSKRKIGSLHGRGKRPIVKFQNRGKD